jgi:hypothetical protein
LSGIANRIADELQEHRVYVDPDRIFLEIISESTLTDKLMSLSEDYRVRSNGYSQRCADIIETVEHYAEIEANDMSKKSDAQKAIYVRIILPLVDCLVARMKSGEIGEFLN